MPYKLSGTNVVKSDSGKVVGKHPNKEKAKRHLAALYANVPDAAVKRRLTGENNAHNSKNTRSNKKRRVGRRQ